MPGEPILTKHLPDHERDYKPMTWERFLLLRAWAKYIAWLEGCTVALVGSALEKTVPRDIDVALIWPEDEFRAKFGSKATREENVQIFEEKRISLYNSAQELVKYDTRIDVRLCPDAWWPEKDRVILAAPGGPEPPNRWGEIEFVVRKVVRATRTEN